MKVEELYNIFPFVRMMRIKKAVAMSGKWKDIDHVFTYIAAGSAEFVVDGIRYFLKTGDIIIMPPYKTHVVLSQGNEPLVQYIIHFDFFETPERVLLEHLDILNKNNVEEIPEQERILKDRVFITTTKDNDRYEIHNSYLRMYKEFMEKKPGYQVFVRSKCMNILSTAVRNGQRDKINQVLVNAKKTKSWVHIESAIGYINLNYNNDNLDNDTISEAIGVSANYLTKVFREYLGFPLHKYIINLKIEKAKQLLMNDNVNITEAAFRSGFSSIHVFSKKFKRMTGMTPSEYLDNIVAKDAFAYHRYVKLQEHLDEDFYHTETLQN